MSKPENQIIQISSAKFLAGCAIFALFFLVLGSFVSLPHWWIAAEVLVTVLSLFVFGSVRYRINKNVLTYGAALVIGSTFWTLWWEQSFLRTAFQSEGVGAFWNFIRQNFLTLHGLNQLVHADTMLFILGLTFFVAVIAQTRLLESLSFAVLTKNKGRVVPTVAILTGVVAFASGILDGVSMIGLMIRTLVIILFLAKASESAVIYSVMVSTAITTVCGIWLAYGEPPNLIMKANLHPYLDNTFFLNYCLPIALASYFVVIWNMSKRLKGKRVEIHNLDILDLHTADIRFIQASKHGKVFTPVEFVEEHASILGSKAHSLIERLQQGEPLGEALLREEFSENVRRELLGKFIAEDLAEVIDAHYQQMLKGNREDRTIQKLKNILESTRKRRVQSQWVGALSFIPFIGFLVWHALNHEVPLFWASFAGFFVALFGIISIGPMRKLALKDARHEYAEYLFLLPLFFSITLLQKTGFFEQIASLLHQGIEKLGAAHIANAQFLGAVSLSAILDNNVVADFFSRALHGLEIGFLHLLAMAQIAGYAVGGCWTHIGSAQSVVAYAFIHKEIDEHYTPFQWIKAVTPVILEIFFLAILIIYIRAWLL